MKCIGEERHDHYRLADSKTVSHVHEHTPCEGDFNRLHHHPPVEHDKHTDEFLESTMEIEHGRSPLF
jgi:hypothetical protein